MPSEPRWLRPDEVIEINRLTVAETGEPHLLRDAALLESALGKPIHHYSYGGEADTVSLATTLLFGIARNHPFEQGNKRTAFTSALIFLEANGYEFHGPDSTDLANLIIDVITHDATEADFEHAIRRHVHVIEVAD